MSRPTKPQWNQPLARVMDVILNCNIKFKHAAEVGRRAVVYCRGQDLFKWVQDNKDMINKKHVDALGDSCIESADDAAEFCDKLIRYGFLYRAQYKPLDETLEKNEDGQYKRPKWPKRLAISQKQSFDPNYFYCCVYEGSKSWQHFMLFCVIAAVLCICMFPAWPLKLKIGLWYVSVVLLSLILALVVVRLILYVLLWFCGYQFWLLPNLFNEDAGFVDSFIPVMDIKKCPNDWGVLLARIFCALLTAATAFKLSQTHSPGDVANFARQSFIDVLDWGRLRLEAPYDSGKALPGVDGDSTKSDNDENAEEDAIPKASDEEDYSCLKSCGFATFEDLMLTKCLVKCSCMDKVVSSECFENCPSATRAALEEARGDACREEAERLKRKQKQ